MKERPGLYATYAAYCAACAKARIEPVTRDAYGRDHIDCSPPRTRAERIAVDLASRDGKPYIGY